jgi:hypothetical protein
LQDMNSPGHVLLICGMPASGKTTFGNWLRDTRGWLHLDLELSDCLTANSLPLFWSRRIWELDAPSLQSFIQHLRSLDRSTVMTWGFHIDCLPLIETMAAADAVPWWFEVDRLAARQVFVGRQTIIRDGLPQPGTPDPAAFDRQFGTMASHWAAISAVFGNQIVRALTPDGAYLHPEVILARLTSEAGETPSDR